MLEPELHPASALWIEEELREGREAAIHPQHVRAASTCIRSKLLAKTDYQMMPRLIIAGATI